MGLLELTADLVFSVSLCAKEEIAMEHRARPEQGERVIPASKQQEVCLGFQHTHLVLPIPLHLAPSFSSPGRRQLCN